MKGRTRAGREANDCNAHMRQAFLSSFTGLGVSAEHDGRSTTGRNGASGRGLARWGGEIGGILGIRILGVRSADRRMPLPALVVLLVMINLVVASPADLREVGEVRWGRWGRGEREVTG